MKLSKKALMAIRENKRCRNRLQLELERNQATIYRWLDNNDVMLTTATALQIIREETGLDDSQILEAIPA